MLRPLIFAIDSSCTHLSIGALLLALHIERFRYCSLKRLRRWSCRLRLVVNQVRLLVFEWLRHLGAAPRPFPRRQRAWNRTPPDIEEKIVLLHLAHPQVGDGQLKLLVERVLGVVRARETFRAILMRNRDVIARLRSEKRTAPRRIVVTLPNRLWGIDLTLVRLFAIWPVWIVGVVDYYGSRLISLERVAAPPARKSAGCSPRLSPARA